MSQTLVEKRELEKKAVKYGYHGLFATPNTIEAAKKFFERSRELADSTGIIIGMAMMQNYWAIEKAKGEL